MSWDHSYYKATCKICGATGFKVESSDDWGRSETSWEGFKSFTEFPNYEYLVGRNKIDRNKYAKCNCGSTDIEVDSRPCQHG